MYTKNELNKLYKQALKGNINAQNELISATRNLGKKANRRLRSIKKYGKGLWAVNIAEERNKTNLGRKRFNETGKGITLKQQYYNLINIENFLESKYSSVSGIKNFFKNQVDILSKPTEERGALLKNVKTARQREKLADYMATDFFKEFVELDSEMAFELGEEALFRKNATIEELELSYDKYLKGEGDLFSVWENWTEINPFE